ncbi:MAG: FAD-dependent monooxygenase [Alphaproteobacteria bacterium]|nr:FAD-dependent monooxygenase [Alphaproteobacteria bacterium]
MSGPTSRPRILIAGGGAGGLTAALALIERGYPVTIYEQASELRELGAGVQIGPNGARVLIELGLGAALDEVVCEAAGKEARIWNTGETFPLFDLGADCIARFGAPYWTAHRRDLQRVLAEAVERRRPGTIRLGARAVGVTQHQAGVRLRLADGEEVEGDALIGADGVHSAIREALFGRGPAEFTGLMAWRGLVPMDSLPPHLRRPVGTNWMGPGSHVVTYPVRRGELLNFVGVVERDDWRVESWTERGTREECAADFAGWHPDVHTIIRAVETPFKWALLGRPPMTQWAEGRVCLLGDACHPTLPFLAQGANMAIEDGLVIARCLDAEPGDPAAAFRRFERARMERTARVVRGSADNTKRFHNALLADPTAAADYIRREMAPEKLRTRYDWAYEYDARAASV